MTSTRLVHGAFRFSGLIALQLAAFVSPAGARLIAVSTTIQAAVDASQSGDTVKVPAGTFRAVRVETVCTNIEKNVICSYTSWYAPGVGLVRYAYDNGSTRDLISFTPGKDAPAKK